MYTDMEATSRADQAGIRRWRQKDEMLYVMSTHIMLLRSLQYLVYRTNSEVTCICSHRIQLDMPKFSRDQE